MVVSEANVACVARKAATQLDVLKRPTELSFGSAGVRYKRLGSRVSSEPVCDCVPVYARHLPNCWTLNLVLSTHKKEKE